MRSYVQLVPGWKPLLVFGLPVLVAIGAVAGAYLYATTTPGSIAHTTAPTNAVLGVPPPAGLLVDVIGAVGQPGLYRLPRGDRVYDAIAAAGGLSTDADPNRLPNLAGRLKDGEQIKVPFVRGAPGGTVLVRTSLNSATLEELAVVPGFNEALAQEVIDYRTNFGGFQNTRELVDILGMSEAEYVVARRYVTL